MPEREEHMPGLVPERDGYLPGVPCWVDASEPDPEAAAGFYSGLFGWEFEDVMPPEAPGKYFTARIRGLDVAAVGWIPDAAPPMAAWNTLPLCMESSGLGSEDHTSMRGAASWRVAVFASRAIGPGGLTPDDWTNGRVHLESALP